MKVVFEKLKNAGYFIFGEKNVTTGVHTYFFSNKKYREYHKEIDFTEFID